MLFFIFYLAGVAELVDALDLGSSDFCRVGSSPSARTICRNGLKIMTKIEEIKNKGLDIEWNMTIPADKINVILDKKYQELSQNIKIPGFRPGKVPIAIIKKRYSKSVMSEILDNLINDNLREVLLEKKIRPSVQPTVNVKSYEEGKDLSLNVIIQKMPDIKKIDLSEFKIEKSILQVSDADIQNTLDDIAKKHERFSPLKKKELQRMVI